MKTISVKLVSRAPLLMNRRPLVEDNDGIKKKGETINHVEEAYKKSWKDEKHGYFVPCEMIEAVLREAGKKVKKGRGSFKNTIQSGVSIIPQIQASMDNGQQVVGGVLLNRTDCDAVDKRWATHPSTRNSILTARCRFDKWTLEFKVQYDETQVKEGELKAIFQEAGNIGVGSYRYKFGTFNSEFI